MQSMEGMAKDAKGWKVSDMSAVRNMTTAIVELKSDNTALREELAALKQSLAKVRADAIRSVLDTPHDCETPNGDIAWSSRAIEEHASQIEAGL
tara:strand:- start:163 stop:444 length:282 start_codon:yes stop_codon:yes gene_type:complete